MCSIQYCCVGRNIQKIGTFYLKLKFYNDIFTSIVVFIIQLFNVKIMDTALDSYKSVYYFTINYVAGTVLPSDFCVIKSLEYAGMTTNSGAIRKKLGDMSHLRMTT